MLLLCSRPTTRHPLFPYTTLFRSAGPGDSGGIGGMGTSPPAESRTEKDAQGEDHGQPTRPREPVPEPDVERPGVRTGDRDRKSTRLNSSHITISYAVFCLKKKTHL